MKKFKLHILIITVLLLFHSTGYASGEIHKFSRVSGDENVTFAATGFEINYNSNTLTPCPINILTPCPIDDANLFCVYNNYIYYSNGHSSGDEQKVSIYRTNIDGTDKTLIANNVSSYSDIYIVDDTLYYTSCDFSVNRYWERSDGGIFKVNLNDCSWKKIVSDIESNLIYCDSDYVYYKVYTGYGKSYYYRIDNEGTCCWNMSENDVEICLDYYNNGTGYYGTSDGIYRCNWDRSVISRITSLPKQPTSQQAHVYNVVNGYVYYWFIPANQGSYRTYTYLYRAPVNGGQSEYISRHPAVGTGAY